MRTEATEFGHHAVNSNDLCFDAWGAGPLMIAAAGRSFRFEDSDRFGPHILTRKDELAERQPGDRSPFWRAHRIWVRQGRRLAKDRMTCIVDEPRPTKVRKIGSRIAIIVEQGDEDGEFVEV